MCDASSSFSTSSCSIGSTRWYTAVVCVHEAEPMRRTRELVGRVPWRCQQHGARRTGRDRPCLRGAAWTACGLHWRRGRACDQNSPLCSLTRCAPSLHYGRFGRPSSLKPPQEALFFNLESANPSPSFVQVWCCTAWRTSIGCQDEECASNGEVLATGRLAVVARCGTPAAAASAVAARVGMPARRGAAQPGAGSRRGG
jgi:hypothetical protein